MGGHAEGVAHFGQPGRSEQVDFDSQVECRVERHGGRRMDDRGAACECGSTRLVEPEPVGADVACHDLDASRDHFVELGLRSDLGPESVEAVVLEDFTLGALLDASHATGTYKQHQFAARRTSQEPLYQGGAHETGGPGDEDAPAIKGLRNHGITLAAPEPLYQMVDWGMWRPGPTR